MHKGNLLRIFRQIDVFLSYYDYNQGEALCDLKYSQIFLLNEMFELKKNTKGAITLTVLGKKTGFSKASLCSALKILKKAGYVDVMVDREDNRKKNLLLTKKAKEAELDAKLYLCSVSDLLCEGMGGRELEEMERSLNKISENINKMQVRSSGGK